MITKKINLPKCPEVTVYYCATINEAYKKIQFEHEVDISDILFESDDVIHGFTITDEFADSIEVFLDVSLPKEIYIKTAVHEGMQAALNVIRRKFFYCFDDTKPIIIGENPAIDDLIFELESSIVGKVLIANEKS